MAKGTEVHRRHEAIREILISEGPMSRRQLVQHLRMRDEPLGFPRPMEGLSAQELAKFEEKQEVKVARALKQMADDGQVCLDEVSAVKFRGAGDTKTQFWKSRDTLEPELEEIAALIALDTVMDSLQWLIPEEIKADLERAREKARSNVGKMPLHSPEKRWLSALRVLAPYSDFERPVHDDDVRRNIEIAIKENRRVNITYRRSGGDACEVVASITDWIVRLPDTISIISWEHAAVLDGVEAEWSGPVCAFEIPLPRIERVEVREEAAYEPTELDRRRMIVGAEYGGYNLDSLRSKVLDGWGDPIRDTYELRASPRLMQRWRGLWIGGQLQILGIDEDGWTVCRYSTKGRPGFLAYLFSLGGDIEVLSPYAIRSRLKEYWGELAAMYSMEQALPTDVATRLEAHYQLGSSLEGGRLYEWDGLDTLDEQNLAASEVWRREPVLVEMLCVALNLYDPRSLVMNEAMTSKTGYLLEAERIANRMPDVRSERELADVLASEFPEAEKSPEFEGFDMALYWRSMAGGIWSDTARWRWDRSQPSGS